MRALAVDLGGSHAACAVVEDRTLLACEEVLLDSGAGLRIALPHIGEALASAMARAGTRAGDCAGLAFSFCGLVDGRRNRVVSANGKYPDAPEMSLAGWCGQRFGIPFRMENDARMALLGEWFAGAARGHDEVVMVTLGTGVGGAAMLGGRLLRGKHFQAGCLGGHLPAVFDGRPCTCGALGCVEAEASTWSMPEVCRAAPGFDASALAAEPAITFEVLLRHARAGDAVASAVRDRCLAVWGAGAVGLIHAYDPEVMVYGGGIMKGAGDILPFLQDYVNRHAWTPWGKVQLRSAALGNRAALLGAIPLLADPEL